MMRLLSDNLTLCSQADLHNLASSVTEITKELSYHLPLLFVAGHHLR